METIIVYLSPPVGRQFGSLEAYQKGASEYCLDLLGRQLDVQFADSAFDCDIQIAWLGVGWIHAWHRQTNQPSQ